MTRYHRNGWVRFDLRLKAEELRIRLIFLLLVLLMHCRITPTSCQTLKGMHRFHHTLHIHRYLTTRHRQARRSIVQAKQVQCSTASRNA